MKIKQLIYSIPFHRKYSIFMKIKQLIYSIPFHRKYSIFMKIKQLIYSIPFHTQVVPTFADFDSQITFNKGSVVPKRSRRIGFFESLHLEESGCNIYIQSQIKSSVYLGYSLSRIIIQYVKIKSLDIFCTFMYVVFSERIYYYYDRTHTIP